jgi:uncharacterized Tic20 family protein
MRETEVLNELEVEEEQAAEDEVAVMAAPMRTHLGLTREEMNWAAIAHASIVLTFLLGIVTSGLGAILGVLVPALIWYAHREKSDYVAEQARQATAFQLAGFAAMLVLALGGTLILTLGWTVSALLVLILVGLLLLPVMLVLTILTVVALVALPIAQVIYGCYAAAETYNGRPFRYAWIADQVDRYLDQA